MGWGTYLLTGGGRRAERRPDDAEWRLAQHLRDMPMHRVIIRSVEAELLSAIDFPRPMLDVGCGDGHFASTVLREAADVGLDPWPEALAVARTYGAHTSLVAASAEQMPFADGAFASVMSNCVVEHIPDVMAAFREVHRVLQPGGLFVLTVPTNRYDEALLLPTLLRRLGLRSAARGYGRFMDRLSFHRTRLPVEGWRRVLESVGFEVTEARGYLSPAAMYWFDAVHWLGAWSVITKRLTNRWVVAPEKVRLLPLARLTELVRAQIDVPDPPYVYFRCHRRPPGDDR